MKNFVAPGANITVIADTAYTGGQGYVLGSIFGIAAGDAAVGDPVILHLQGIYELDGLGAVGDAAYWDNTDTEVAGASAAGLFKIGTIVGVDGTKVQVRLNGTDVEAAA